MANVFNVAKRGIIDGTIDIQADTLRVLLYTTSPNADLTDAQLDLTTVANVEADAAFAEATHASYTGQGASGRLTLGARTASTDNTNNRSEQDAADLTWTALNSFTITGALLFKFVTNDSDSIPIAYYNLADTTCNGGDIILQWNVEGFLWLTE